MDPKRILREDVEIEFIYFYYCPVALETKANPTLL